MKLGVIIISCFLFLSFQVNAQQKTAGKYIQKFLEFTSKTYEVFTDEIENYLKHPNAFIPDDEEGKFITEIQKQAADDVQRVYAKARYKFGKSATDSSSTGNALQTIQEKFLIHFDSSVVRIKQKNKEQYASLKSLPAEKQNDIIHENKSSFDKVLKKLSGICDKIDGEYEDYMRCNMIKEALNQCGKDTSNW